MKWTSQKGAHATGSGGYQYPFGTSFLPFLNWPCFAKINTKLKGGGP
jgi:hypothetical protein